MSRRHLHIQRFALKERNSEHREPKYLCSTEKHYLDLPKLETCLLLSLTGERHHPYLTKLHKDPWKDDPEQTQTVPLLTRCTDMQENPKCLSTVNTQHSTVRRTNPGFSPVNICMYLDLYVFVHSFMYLFIISNDSWFSIFSPNENNLTYKLSYFFIFH